MHATDTIARARQFARAHTRPMPAHAPHLVPLTLIQPTAAAETPPPPAIVECKAIVLARPDLFLTPAAERALQEWEARP